MPQKSLDPEVVQRAQELRAEGHSLADIASELSISSGSASNACRAIKPKKTTGKDGPQSTKDTTAAVVGGPYEDDTKALANQVKQARLRSELDEIEDRRRQRAEIDDLRVRERKLMLQLDEARPGANKGDGAVAAEITQLRSELAELREARHQAELRAIEDRHASEVRRLEQQIASIGRSGLGRYDLMSQGFDKLESMVVLAGSKVDSFMSNQRSDGAFMMALQLGLSPDELEILKQGLAIPITRAQFDLIKSGSGIEPQEGEYEALVAMTERRNQQYRELVARVGPRLRQGGAVRTGKPGKAPEPGQPEPVILKAETRIVKCQRCGCEFDIDLAEAKSKAGVGKKLFIHCPGKGCGFMLDIMEMLPELKPAGGEESPAPECFVPGQSGCAAPAHRRDAPGHLCKECTWA